MHSLDLFLGLDGVQSLVLVINEQYRDQFADYAADGRLTFADPGARAPASSATLGARAREPTPAPPRTVGSGRTRCGPASRPAPGTPPWCASTMRRGPW